MVHSERTLVSLGLVCMLAVMPVVADSPGRGIAVDESPEPGARPSSAVGHIPFKVSNNHALIPVSIAGSEPLRVVLDSAMNFPGLILYKNDRVDALRLEFADFVVPLAGAGGSGETVSARIAPGTDLIVQDLTISKADVLVTPASLSSDHDGVIGKALFAHYVVAIDYDEQVITLYSPDGFVAATGGKEVTLSLQEEMPYVKATVTMSGGTAIPVRLLVDTGGWIPLSLNTASDDRITLPPRVLEASVGRGVSGTIKGNVGRVSSLDLAGFRLSSVITVFPVAQSQSPAGLDVGNGILGNGAMRRFNVVFDYVNRRMILKPNGQFQEPFEYDMSGLELRAADGGGLKVVGVLAGSPAEVGGFKIDDVLTEVEGQPVSGLGHAKVRELLRRGDTEVKLRIRRGADELELSLRLKRLI